jgi:hypothetical protein
LRNVRRDASRRFRNKKREYLKGKITDIKLNRKNKNIRDLYRGITEFKKGYHPKTNLVNDERGDLLADPQKILTRWKNLTVLLLYAWSFQFVYSVRFPIVADMSIPRLRISSGG